MCFSGNVGELAQCVGRNRAETWGLWPLVKKPRPLLVKRAHMMNAQSLIWRLFVRKLPNTNNSYYAYEPAGYISENRMKKHLLPYEYEKKAAIKRDRDIWFLLS